MARKRKINSKQLYVCCVLLLGSIGYSIIYNSFLSCKVTTRTRIVDTVDAMETAKAKDKEFEKETLKKHEKEKLKKDEKMYLILFYLPPQFIRRRFDALSMNFSKCEYNNCRLTQRLRHARISDAILIHRNLRTFLRMEKPQGQIWIFVEHESPLFTYDVFHIRRGSPQWEKLKYKFNWTMTYNKAVADIHLPYGELKQYERYVAKDYEAIAANKTKGALIVTSHCDTYAKRLEYIDKLKQFVEVDVWGKCGEAWDCGRKGIRNDCFDLLDKSYSYYLAFENALCEQYHSEKLFENFKYDILIVTRGGMPHDTVLPKGSVIDYRDFKDAEHLGTFLNNLQNDKVKYAEYLSMKSQFYSIDYLESYQRAMCDLCYRLNHQDRYHKIIPDIPDVYNYQESCMDGT